MESQTPTNETLNSQLASIKAERDAAREELRKLQNSVEARSYEVQGIRHLLKEKMQDRKDAKKERDNARQKAETLETAIEKLSNRSINSMENMVQSLIRSDQTLSSAMTTYAVLADNMEV